MTTVVTCKASPVPSTDVADGKYPPQRGARIQNERWKAFGLAIGDRKRSAWISDFVDWVIPDGQVWLAAQEVARKRQENLGGVIVTGLKRYVTRNRHLLDDADGE